MNSRAVTRGYDLGRFRGLLAIETIAKKLGAARLPRGLGAIRGLGGSFRSLLTTLLPYRSPP
jgi:hypothetical protein